jgi:hypothetical protein
MAGPIDDPTRQTPAIPATRRFRSKHDIDWLALRIDYERSTLSITELARKYNLPRSTLHSRLAASGWQSHAGLFAARTGDASSSLSDTAVLKAKLKSIVEKKLAMIERKFDEAADSPADVQRAERMIGPLLRSHERLEAITTKEAAAAQSQAAKLLKGGPSDSTVEDTGDADLWRHELAERIRKLRERCGC